MTGLAIASFLAFGTLLVLFGANATGIIAHFGLDYAEFGLLGSVLSLGLGSGIVVAGPICDRFPRRPLFVSACLVVVASTMSLGPETTYHGLFAHMIALGFGAGFYETVLNAIIIEEFPDTAGRRLLFIHSGAPFAACVVPLLMDLARGFITIEWHAFFRLAGLLHIPLLIAASFVTMERARPSQSTTQPITERSRKTPARRNFVLLTICVAVFAYVGVETALTIFVVDHVTTDLALPSARAARTISALWGGLFIGRLAAGLLPRSPGAGMTAMLAACAAGILLAFESGAFGSPELAMLTIGLVLGGVFPVMIGLAGRAYPSSPATAVGLAGGLGSLGGFVIPWTTGRVAAEAGLPIAIASLALWLLLLAAAATGVFFRRT